MSNQRRRRNSQSSSPNPTPRRSRNTISLGATLAALAVILLIQFSGGNLGMFGTSSAPIEQQDSDNQNSETSNGEVAVAPTATEDAPDAAATQSARASAIPRSTPRPTPTANAPPAPARASDLPPIAYADLPPEAHETVALIEQGGPFPFARDDVTFENRERLLPNQPRGYYQEYTVVTPGESDRGARRIVAGEAGEMYYTDDHYASFYEIVD